MKKKLLVLFMCFSAFSMKGQEPDVPQSVDHELLSLPDFQSRILVPSLAKAIVSDSAITASDAQKEAWWILEFADHIPYQKFKANDEMKFEEKSTYTNHEVRAAVYMILFKCACIKRDGGEANHESMEHTLNKYFKQAFSRDDRKFTSGHKQYMAAKQDDFLRDIDKLTQTYTTEQQMLHLVVSCIIESLKIELEQASNVSEESEEKKEEKKIIRDHIKQYTQIILKQEEGLKIINCHPENHKRNKTGKGKPSNILSIFSSSSTDNEDMAAKSEAVVAKGDASDSQEPKAYQIATKRGPRLKISFLSSKSSGKEEPKKA